MTLNKMGYLCVCIMVASISVMSSIHCKCFAQFCMCTRSFKNLVIGFAPICYSLADSCGL